MKSAAVVALAVLESVQAFQAPALARPTRSSAVSMFAEGDLGVTAPLGEWDPLGLIESRDMRRYEIMEIKHGRAAMLGFVHVVLTHAGVRWPGYIMGDSFVGGLKFADVPSDLFASLETIPTAGWLQIMITTAFVETGVAGSRPSGTPFGWFGFGYPGTFGEAQTDDKAPGDIGGDVWQRYDDPEVKAFKLNAERNNGRAAMLGITGCLIHELLGVDALYPTGGLSGAAPPTIFS